MSKLRSDTEYMARAIQLAKQGLFTTDPNPRVGCVLVKQGKIIGEGWHQISGEPHAEVHALRLAGDEAKGCTAYVTLEPCAHFGKTPPCAEALVDAGVDRVVFASVDPNPLVAGKGAKLLEKAGIQVESGLLSEQATALNPGFFSRFKQNRPYIRIKLAMSVDGRTAMQSGESQWITGPKARADVQKLRARSSAIVTGAGTVKYDDPQMTVRPGSILLSTSPETAVLQRSLLKRKPQPDRYILSTSGQIPLSSQIFHQSGKNCLVVPDCIDVSALSQPDLSGLDRSEFELLPLPSDKGGGNGVDLTAFIHELSRRGCNEILVEAGANLAGEFIQANLVDELWIYMAPILLGSEARPLLELPIHSMADKRQLALQDLRVIGGDIRFIYVPNSLE